MGGGWGILGWLGHFLREGIRFAFGIWVGIELFDTGKFFAGKERKGLEAFEKRREGGGW